MHLVFLALPLLLCVLVVSANLEKLVFIAPKPATHESARYVDALRFLDWERLTPTNSTLRRTFISKVLGTEEQVSALEAWILLDGLTPNQRYEVRICWSATV